MGKRSYEEQREELARILHDANTGSIVPDENDPVPYAKLAEAILAEGFVRLPDEEWEYGFGHRRKLGAKRPYATPAYSLEDAREMVALSEGWDDEVISRRRAVGPWELFEDPKARN